MPYTIRKQPNIPMYKVYSNGRPLSIKPLTKEMARKQQIAVSLAEGIYPRKKKVTK
jgi:hypothetical protein